MEKMESTLPLTNENINMLWAGLVIGELIKNGLNYFCLSPGYRCAPLIHALVHHPNTQKISCIDERAAAFHALGYAKACGRAAVLICTSGTALGNYMPAVMEAARDGVPMFILSADRPPELIKSDANQTLPQHNIYGQFSKFFLSLPLPEPQLDPSPWMGQLDQAVWTAHQNVPGPVHVNIPFKGTLVPQQLRESLEGSLFFEKAKFMAKRETPWEKNYSFSIFSTSFSLSSNFSSHSWENFWTDWDPSSLGLLVIGRRKNHPQQELQEREDKLLLELIEKFPGPIFVDIASSLKHSLDPQAKKENILIWDFDHPFATFLMDHLVESTSFRYIMHLGESVVSKNYYLWVNRHPHLQLIRVNMSLPLQDASQLPHIRIHAPLAHFLEKMLQKPVFDQNTHLPIANQVYGPLQIMKNKLMGFLESAPLSYLGIASTLSSLMPQDHILYVGNSTPIRAFEASTLGNRKKIKVVVHRGVSGIEGFIAAATGFLQGQTQRLTLVLGDLALLHDLNSLMLLSGIPVPMILVVVNNFSGGLFTRLPLAQYPQTLHPFISTPHHWRFESAARQFQLDYICISSLNSLREVYQKALSSKRHILIEIPLENDKDNEIFQKYLSLSP